MYYLLSTVKCDKWVSLGESKYYLLYPETPNIELLSLSAFQNTYLIYYFIYSTADVLKC